MGGEAGRPTPWGDHVAVFIGTYENKVDRKGRVSVPFTFRQALGSQSFNGIVAFKSFRAEAIEACGYDFMEHISDSIGSLNLFSDDQDSLSSTILGGANPLSFDGEGRIVLPADLVDHAGIGDRAAFVGKGPIFQIWEPEALRRHMDAARSRAKAEGLSLPLRQPGGERA